MGLLSWFFGSKKQSTKTTAYSSEAGHASQSSPATITLNGPGTFSCEIVGESYYQENLKKIVGDYSENGVEKDVLVKLIHENDNPYDNKAISIEIDGYKVGNLSKLAARYYRRKIIEHGREGQIATCKAKIRGGWDRGNNDFGLYGVVLDLPPKYIEGCEDECVEVIEIESEHPNIIIFQAEKRNLEVLSECIVGDYVNFWAPEDKPEKIFIFKRGSLGGNGRIGYVPNKYSYIISNHLREGLKFETEILEFKTGKIKCRLIPKEETDAKRLIELKKAGERISVELNKKYRKKPKDNFEIYFRLPKNHKQKEGNILFLEKQPIEFYVQNPDPLCINLVDKQGRTITQTNSYIIRMLRAHFNNYTVTIKISSIQKPDKVTLKYVNDVAAKAIVNFESEIN